MLVSEGGLFSPLHAPGLGEEGEMCGWSEGEGMENWAMGGGGPVSHLPFHGAGSGGGGGGREG